MRVRQDVQTITNAEASPPKHRSRRSCSLVSPYADDRRFDLLYGVGEIIRYESRSKTQA